MSERGESSAGEPFQTHRTKAQRLVWGFFSFLMSWWAGLSALRWTVFSSRPSWAATSAKRRTPKSRQPLGIPDEDEDERGQDET